MNKESRITFTGLLWPPAIKYSEGILSRIKKEHVVVASDMYSFVSKESFKKFVVGIYKPDRTPMRRVMAKFKVMNKYEYVVMAIYIGVDNPKIIPHTKSRLRGTFYCRDMKVLKKAIRNKFKKKIKGYTHDVIIHISDNEEHNRRTKKLLNKLAHPFQ